MHVTDDLDISLAVFNLFDDDGNDITYFYESRLPGEAAPVEDTTSTPLSRARCAPRRLGGSEVGIRPIHRPPIC
jgi:hypothetical protein